MYISEPELTIVIPTRNRAFTLETAIQTCISQDYEKLTILISDNFSDDGTYDVVQSFSDPRIKYINTSQRKSMTRNWEFALSHIKKGYVTIIGDDDGFLPHAIEDIANLIKDTQIKAIAWYKAEYHWPDHPNDRLRDKLIVPSANVLLEVNSKTALRDASRFWLPYNKLPNLYNSFVSYDVIRAAKVDDGDFFKSITPDVYSGFALLKGLETYLFSSRPFSVNGASSFSNGTSGINNKNLNGEALRFLSEIDLEQNVEFQAIPGAVYSNIAEALLQANKYCYDSQLKINRKLITKLILRDIHKYLPERKQESLNELFQMVEPHGLRSFAEYINKDLEKAKLSIDPSANTPSSQVLMNGNIVLNADKFNVKNIYDACVLVGKLLPKYNKPVGMYKYSALTLFVTAKCTNFSTYQIFKDNVTFIKRTVTAFVSSLFTRISAK